MYCLSIFIERLCAPLGVVLDETEFIAVHNYIFIIIANYILSYVYVKYFRINLIEIQIMRYKVN
jgi:hypothetical protein